MSLRTVPAARPWFDSRRCKRCGVCAAFCPRQVIELRPREAAALAHPEACTGCGTCDLVCPDFAVSMGMEAPSDGVDPSAAYDTRAVGEVEG